MHRSSCVLVAVAVAVAVEAAGVCYNPDSRV
jgi:hypothetical protein